MHLLVLTDRAGGGTALLPAFEYLDHTIEEGPLDPEELTGLSGCDAVVLDATEDLRSAASVCRAVTVHDLRRPVVVVVDEGGLAALKPTWGFSDWMLPSASPVEIETRLRVVCSRWEADGDRGEAAVGGLVVDEDSYQVRLHGEPLDLTYKEFELLKTLANSPDRVFSRELLLQEVWGYDYYGGSRTIDVHVRRLRAKLGPEHESMIETVRGVGYKLVNPRTKRTRDGRGSKADGPSPDGPGPDGPGPDGAGPEGSADH